MDEAYLVVFCTVPDESIGLSIAHAVVSEQKAACCNIIPGLRSIYRWQGKVCDDSELLLMMKTTSAVYPELEQLIKQHHPYEVPEIIAVPVECGISEYLMWVKANVGTKDK